MKLHFVVLALGVCLFSAGCGGGGSSTPPPPTTYTIGGTVSGLTGTGLVLQDNAGNNLTVSASATTFAFTTAINSGSTYKVTVLTQPSTPVQSCTVTNGSGTASANVTTVSIACTTTTYTVGGTISGLVGTGLELQNNGLNNLAVSANGTFAFTTAIDSGSSYKVTVVTQPSTPVQNCVVTSGSGTATGNVTSVSIACTTITYTVGGMASGLVGTVVLQDNGGNNLSLTANGPFTFSAGVGEGLPYAVSVLTQPASPIQDCVVTGGGGTSSANVTNVVVTCSTTMYTIGGTVSGLTGTGLALQDNSGDNLNVTANGSFTFTTKLDSVQNYNVTVLTNPTVPQQTCGVTGGGTGTANASVNVVVTCSNISQWTWENGPNTDDQLGVYGTMGTASTSNVPGARYSSVSWSDANGNFWLFGGLVYLSPTNAADFNDLWEGNYNSSGQWQWNWVGGEDVAGVGGTYGTLGTAASGNLPGARDSHVSWTDASGNFWIFGGHGYDYNKDPGDLNDLWEYSTSGPNAGQWTWVSGSNAINQFGNYGTIGTGTTGTTPTVPGARYNPVSWVDKKGNFWLFGGYGFDSTGAVGYLNDLWEGNYNSSNEWVWTWQGPVGSNVEGEQGVWGSVGESSPTSFPGPRYLSMGWTDAQGNLWMFGGFGTDSVGDTAVLSDLWKYSASSTTPEWTWVGGLEKAEYQGYYTTLGVAGPGNLGVPGVGYVPGSRKGSVTWTDSFGNFWLFGGVGIDSNDTAGELNDLWQYNPTTGEWTWESGANTVNQLGNYGTVGVAATANVPGARGISASWIDSSGNLWLFGGNGPESGINGSFSDLWKFVP